MDTTKNIACSECFHDEGLRLNAEKIGIEGTEICPQCKSTKGYKLTLKLLRLLCENYFVDGSIIRWKFGGAPYLAYNDTQRSGQINDFPDWLKEDYELIEKLGQVGIFYYGPRFWMFGEIEPLKALLKKKTREGIIARIMNSYPTKIINERTNLYRLRLNPKEPNKKEEYDTPPDRFLGKGRFDNKNFPVLYTSPDIELCIHECRTRMEDEVYICKLNPNCSLKLLDLTVILDEPHTTEFESLDIAMHFLFLAGKHSYPICRAIAKVAFESGYDGVIYPSYFSYVRQGITPFNTIYGISIRRIESLKDYAQSESVPNIILFGRPIAEGIVKTKSIDKVIIKRVTYDLSFGPCLPAL